MDNANRNIDPSTGIGSARSDDWATEEQWWRNNFSSRPYTTADRAFDDYAPAYRYGFESARQHRGRQWDEIENDLERGWDRARGASQTTWQQVKEAVKDAWDHVTGDEHERHARTSDGTVTPDVRL